MNIEKELNKYLYANKIFVDEIYELPGNEVVISLSGDWKHEHLRTDCLVAKFCEINGLILKDKSMDVTNEDGSDYFTADHYYKIIVDKNSF